MFDTAESRVITFAHDRAAVLAAVWPEEPLRQCIDPAERWVLRRRAHRPHYAPRRLPVVARVG